MANAPLNTCLVRVLMILLFLLFFGVGTVSGFFSISSLNVVARFGVAVAVVLVIVLGGGLGLLERKFIWRHYFYSQIRRLDENGRTSGGSAQPMSLGLSLGLLCGWFVAANGIPV